MKVGLREANQRFAETIRSVRHGHDVILTERGRPLAVIRRIAVDDEAARLQELGAEGLVVTATNPEPMPSPRWRAEPTTGGRITDTVSRDRDETA